MENWRHFRFLLGRNTIKVIPEGASASTWYLETCGILDIAYPRPGDTLSTPFVIQGSVVLPVGIQLSVARIEAWSNDKKVGEITNDRLDYQGTHTNFLLPVTGLPPGSHSLLIQVFLQTEANIANVTLPIIALPDPEQVSPTQGYRGNIDLPAEGELQSLPVTLQGWAVIPGSARGTGVGTVEVWHGPKETGRLVAEAIYGLHRSDVAQALGDPRFISSGFIAHISDLPAGEIDLYVYVRDRLTDTYVLPAPQQSHLVHSISMAEGKVTDAAWPVALAVDPDGRLFYAELLTGNIRIFQNGSVVPEPFVTIESVSNFGESGFLGLALHPDFNETPFVYAMYVVDDPETGFPSGQRILRYRDVNGIGKDRTVILDNLPAATHLSHNGGRLKFGPDGKLYVTIGDTNVKELSQDTTNVAGSILRYNPDGSIPADNPIPGSPVYAYGLRNVFGLAFQPNTDSLYATENGPGGFDEVNKIEAGQNYGWPLHMGKAEVTGFTDPIAVYGSWPESPIGPSGATFTSEYPDILLFCAFHDFLLRAIELGGPELDRVESKMVLSKNCALDVTYGSDGWLYYSTPFAIYRARIDDLLLLYEQERQQESRAVDNSN
jgi:glucose/arabinose dehydrogenase